MTLQDILNDLTYGELSNHGMCMEGKIGDIDKPKVVSAINSGLLDLYTMFPLLTKELTFIQYSYITQYHLDIKYARTNKESGEKIKYIYDSKFDPFLGDNLRIESVSNEIGDLLLLNSNSECLVGLTPDMNTLEIPNPVNTNALFVTYRARHPTVTIDTLDLDVSFPHHFRNALLAFVGSRVYSGGTAPEHVAKSQELLQKYEMYKAQLNITGMGNLVDNHLNCKPIHGGWI